MVSLIVRLMRKVFWMQLHVAFLFVGKIKTVFLDGAIIISEWATVIVVYYIIDLHIDETEESPDH